MKVSTLLLTTKANHLYHQVPVCSKSAPDKPRPQSGNNLVSNKPSV